jgi:hypothetical protein
LFHFAGTRFFGLHKPFQGNLPPFVPLFHIYIKTYVGQNTLYNVYRLAFSLLASLPSDNELSRKDLEAVSDMVHDALRDMGINPASFAWHIEVEYTEEEEVK